MAYCTHVRFPRDITTGDACLRRSGRSPPGLAARLAYDPALIYAFNLSFIIRNPATSFAEEKERGFFFLHTNVTTGATKVLPVLQISFPRFFACHGTKSLEEQSSG